MKCRYRTIPETVSVRTSASGLLTDTRLQLRCLELLGKERVTQLVQMLVQVLMVSCTHAIEVILLIQGWRVMYLVGSAATGSQTSKSRAKGVRLNILRNLASVSCRLHSHSQIKTNLMQHCAVFISAESLYMFRAQAPIIRSI